MPNSNLIVQIIDAIEFGERLGSPIEDRTADEDWDIPVKRWRLLLLRKRVLELEVPPIWRDKRRK